MRYFHWKDKDAYRLLKRRMLIVAPATNNSSFHKSWTTLHQQVHCQVLKEAFQHFLQIILVLFNCWLKIEAHEDQAERLNNPKPKPSPSLQMLPAGLQHSFYLFISLKIPPQNPFLFNLTAELQMGQSRQHHFCFAWKPITTPLLWRNGCVMTDSFQFFPAFHSSLQWLLQPGVEACCSQSQPAGTQQDLGVPALSKGDTPGCYTSARWQVQEQGSLHEETVTSWHCAHGCSYCCRCADLLLSGTG